MVLEQLYYYTPCCLKMIIHYLQDVNSSFLRLQWRRKVFILVPEYLYLASGSGHFFFQESTSCQLSGKLKCYNFPVYFQAQS